MFRRIKIITAILAIIMLASCDSIITDPNPLIGCYKIVVADGAYSYAFSLREDGTYDILQYAESGGYATIGTYTIALASFDFKKATGYITFVVESQMEGLSSYCFTKDVENRYAFEWDANAVDAVRTLILEPISGGDEFPGEAVSMLDSEYYAERERWTGIPAPEPEIPEGGVGGEGGTEDGDGGEANE